MPRSFRAYKVPDSINKKLFCTFNLQLTTTGTQTTLGRTYPRIEIRTTKQYLEIQRDNTYNQLDARCGFPKKMIEASFDGDNLYKSRLLESRAKRSSIVLVPKSFHVLPGKANLGKVTQ